MISQKQKLLWYAKACVKGGYFETHQEMECLKKNLKLSNKASAYPCHHTTLYPDPFQRVKFIELLTHSKHCTLIRTFVPLRFSHLKIPPSLFLFFIRYIGVSEPYQFINT